MLIFLIFLSFDKIAAVVGNKAITEKEVTYFSRLYPGVSKEDILDKLIMGRVIMNTAKQETLVVTDEEVIKTKEQMIENIPILSSILTNSYIDSLYSEEIRIQLYTRKLIENKYRNRINIAPTDVYNFYKTHKDSFRLPNTVTLEKIEIPVILKEDSRLLKLTDKIIDGLISDQKFSELSRKYSDDPATKYVGGKLGVFKPEDLPAYLSGVLMMNEGDVDLFKSPRGYHIVKLNEKGFGGLDLSHIFLEFDFTYEELKSAENRANKLRQRIINGDSVTSLEISPMGTIPVNSLGYQISSIIDTIDVGFISKPILEADNFYLLKVIDKNKGGVPPFSEVKLNIQNILYQRKMQVVLEEWFNDAKEMVYVNKL